jgi:lipid II:glycine glycyltransferase (peptidoglycan interpeptide bridge formation enzyme)
MMVGDNGRTVTDETFDAATLRSDPVAWDRFAALVRAPSYLQASPWASVKRPNGWDATRAVADGPHGPIGAQVLVRRPRPLHKGFGYAARGPISTGPLDDAAIGAFTDAVRAAAGEMHVAHVRVDPELEDPDGTLAAAFKRAGWRRAPEINPRTTRILDIGRPEDEVWNEIHRKWRQSITKAGRDGTTVVPGAPERLSEFHAIHVRSMERAALPYRTEQTYRNLWNAFAPSGHADLLFAEAPDGETLATILLIGWGPTTNDLYGGMTDPGAKRRSNYLIKWHAIQRARELGYTRYDLWGLPTPAVAAFKEGWGGRQVEYVGAWDLVLDPLGRLAFETAVSVRNRLVRLRGGRRDPD